MVTCPVCEGNGGWHFDGTVCHREDCNARKVCVFCGGERRVKKTWGDYPAPRFRMW